MKAESIYYFLYLTYLEISWNIEKCKQNALLAQKQNILKEIYLIRLNDRRLTQFILQIPIYWRLILTQNFDHLLSPLFTNSSKIYLQLNNPV